MLPIEKTEKYETYKQVFDAYKLALKDDPDFSFKKHCRQWSISTRCMGSWLNRQNIFINDLKQEAKDAAAAAALDWRQRPTGTFVSVRPENEVMSGWRNTEIPRVEIYLLGKVRLSLRKTSVASIMTLLSTYAEKGGR
jgi:hypothetical protein